MMLSGFRPRKVAMKLKITLCALIALTLLPFLYYLPFLLICWCVICATELALVRLGLVKAA